MGEKSDSKKGSSPYVVLENRPLDQWKVTELKEELKKRKLATKGLKEELVKRLDEAVRADMDDANKNLEDDFNSEAEPVVHSDDAEDTADVMDHTDSKNEKLEGSNTVDELGNKNGEKTDVELELNTGHADSGLEALPEKTVAEDDVGVVSTRVEAVQVVREVTVETTVTVTEESGGDLSQLPRNREQKPGPESPEQEQAEPEPNPSDLINGKQVDEVSNIQSDSISIDTVPVTEKNDLKDNVIADDVKLEINEVSKIQSSTDMILDDTKSELVQVAEGKDVKNDKDNLVTTDVNLGLDVKFENEPSKETANDEKTDGNDTENIDITKKNDYGDVGSLEKLNLDRSSGDDSMEEDALESKQTDSKFSSDEVDNRSGKIEVNEDNSVKDMVEDAPADKDFMAVEDKSFPSMTSTKRKIHDQEKAVENNETVKRRRWNNENLKVPEQQSANRSVSTTPKDAFLNQAKHTFSRSASTKSQDIPKERVVPPSSKTPTTSLRIDNFLRPFTLKAVQEFLGKTGTVVSFWMDQIKTHCYITYASVEEAIETRNAVCNLQWPVNGGRLLMADFVDPEEVKKRVDPPPPSPATPATTIPPPTTIQQPPQPSPRLKQQLPPPPSLPPPPPLANPPPAPYRLPPPPPPPEKIDPPIVTLDDLFKKTRATPRIYYLPLSDEQVAAKASAQGKPVN